MGVVHKAEDRFVALKFLPLEVARDPQEVRPVRTFYASAFVVLFATNKKLHPPVEDAFSKSRTLSLRLLLA